MTKPTYHLTGQVTYPSPSISLCAQSLHWIKACFCVPFANIKTFCTNVWVLLYKNFSSYGTSSSCCLRKYINIFFFFFFLNSSVQISSVFLRPTFNCTLSSPILGPSPPSQQNLLYLQRRGGRGAGGGPSGRVGAGGWRRWVQVVRVAALGVGGRRAALAVLLG